MVMLSLMCPPICWTYPENRALVDLEFRMDLGIGDIDFGLGSVLILMVALGDGGNAQGECAD